METRVTRTVTKKKNKTLAIEKSGYLGFVLFLVSLFNGLNVLQWCIYPARLTQNLISRSARATEQDFCTYL